MAFRPAPVKINEFADVKQHSTTGRFLALISESEQNKTSTQSGYIPFPVPVSGAEKTFVYLCNLC